MPHCAKNVTEPVLKSLRCDCATSECKTLACKYRKNLVQCSDSCSCVNLNCENPYKKDEDDSESGNSTENSI